VSAGTGPCDTHVVRPQVALPCGHSGK
jgi:hypothetical protein